MSCRIYLFDPTKMAAVCEQCNIQAASDDMVIAYNEDNLQVIPLFNAHRNANKKISQQHSHFRIVIQSCV